MGNEQVYTAIMANEIISTSGQYAILHQHDPISLKVRWGNHTNPISKHWTWSEEDPHPKIIISIGHTNGKHSLYLSSSHAVPSCYNHFQHGIPILAMSLWEKTL